MNTSSLCPDSLLEIMEVNQGHPSENKQRLFILSLQKQLPSFAFGREGIKDRQELGKHDGEWKKGKASEVLWLEVVCLGHWRLANEKRGIYMICWGAYLAFSGWSWIGKEGRGGCRLGRRWHALKPIPDDSGMIAAEVAWLSRLVTAESSMVIYVWPQSFCVFSPQRERTAGMEWKWAHTHFIQLPIPPCGQWCCLWG